MKKSQLKNLLFASVALTLFVGFFSACGKDDNKTEPADTSKFTALVDSCQTILNGATTTDYPQSAITTFSNVLTTAKTAAAKSGISQTEVDNLVVQLRAAKDTFLAAAYGAIPSSALIMGDAVKGGWALTDLSLYSGSSVGYMAGIIDTTNVSGILRIDLNKTDFGQDNPFPAYLYYNPDTEQRTIKVQLPAGNYDVYDAISEKKVLSNAASSGDVVLKGDSVCLLVFYPAGHVQFVIKSF